MNNSVPIYRIYDTIEKRHRDDMFVGVDGFVYRMLEQCLYDDNITYPLYEIAKMEDQDRYIVERCTGLYDKNKVLMLHNDIITNGRFVGVIVFVNGSFLIEHTINGIPVKSSLDANPIKDMEVIGHALRDEHLLSDK